MEVPRQFGRYRVTGTLGSGAMGHVYAAVDEVLGRTVAVKTLREGGSGLGARMLDERFRLEARAIAALNHPGIVQVYDLDLAAQPPYLVMERMSGPSLKELIERGALPAGDVRALGIQIARALAAAHAGGILHRDVKPANILGAAPGTWKLADFGVAHVPDSSLTMTGQFIGSPAYAPPEALLRGQSTEAGDVFGLGATLYYAAAGRWPRHDATDRALLAPLPSLRTLVPELPPELIAAIDRAVRMEPDHRPSATELADWLASDRAPTATASVDTETVAGHVRDRAAPAAARRAPTPPIADTTEHVPDDTRDLPAAAAPRRWPLWLLGGALIATAAIAIPLGLRRSGAPAADAEVDAGAARTAPADAAPLEPPPLLEDAPVDAELADAVPRQFDQPPPGQFRAFRPPMPDPAASAAWSQVVDALYERTPELALRRLVDWERRWGATDETRALHEQFDAAGIHGVE